ncbi:MAG: SUMF1/EgtB/PvdO family nonheme iron enzyme [Pseudomonadales bacterium]|nr:SUMF1/EgtB/PvdO family nonheme iron enzyme [Pseudomonadales bacterium]
MDLPGYKITRHIGQEEFADVYLAIQLSVGRQVCLKIIDSHTVQNPDIRQSFHQQAEKMGSLSHPQIVRIFDFGHYKNLYFIAMQYLPGEPLLSYLKKNNLELDEKIVLFDQITQIIHAAHEQGYVLIELQSDYFCMHAQQGLMLRHAPGIQIAGQNNTLRQTVNHKLNKSQKNNNAYYLSPEQSQGKMVDIRSDFYSLGIIFYYILLLKPPFSGRDTVNIAVKHLHDAIPTLPTKYQTCQTLLNTLLAKKPHERCQDDKALFQQLAPLNKNSLAPKNIKKTDKKNSVFQVGNNTFTQHLFSAMSDRFNELKHLRFSLSTGLVYLPLKGYASINNAAIDVHQTLTSQELQKGMSEGQFKQLLKTPHCIGIVVLLLFSAMTLILWPYDDMHPKPTAKITPANQVIPSPIPTPEIVVTGKENTHTKEAPMGIDDDVKTENPLLIKQYQSLKNENTDKDIEPKKTKKLFPFIINTSPQHAKIRLMNIKPQYHQGIKLPSGKYIVQISANEFIPQTHTLTIKNRAFKKNILLLPKKKKSAFFQDPLSDNSLGPMMRRLKSGPLSFGSKKNRPSRIMPGFSISQFEISVAEFDRFSRAQQRPLANNNKRDRNLHPVVNISWQDAVDYSQWLSQETGEIYRLASEAQWEYAAKAGQHKHFPWQDEKISSGQANCKRGCDSTWVGVFSASTAPIDSYSPNAWGLYNMAGNAAEWVLDCHQDKASFISSKQSQNTRCKKRVIRGGSYKSTLKNIQLHSRSSEKPNKKRAYIGFRIVSESGP